MGSNYLVARGGEFDMPVAQRASSIIDAYLKRPEGLVYNTDASGAPCSMAAASASMTFKLSSAIAAGSNITATVTPALVKQDYVGKVLVLDNTSATVREACVISSVTGNNQVTLLTVQFPHAVGAVAQTGLTISEDRSVPSKRSIARLARWPVVNVVSILGRYAYGRRSDQVGGLYQEMNLLAAVQTFGGPPQWIPVPVAQCSWSDSTGEIWIPAGLLMAYYSDVRIEYIAGYAVGNVPDPVVHATAAVASALIGSSSELGGQVRLMRAGDTEIQRFAASVLDDDARRSLEPFKARTTF